MKSYKQLLEDVQPGYAPKEISYGGYTTKNLHHVPDAAKAFQATITRVQKGMLKDNGEVVKALKDTDTYMKLNDMHLEQEKDLDPTELDQWLAAHEEAKSALTKIGEFEHHYDYWNSHNTELQYLKANQSLPQEAESMQIEEGPYSSGQLKASPEHVKQANKVPSGGRTTTIVDRDAKGVYTLTMKDGKEVSKVYKESIEIDEALDFKKEAAKHMKDMHDKNATPAGKAYAQKMLRRALEASKMKDKAAATKHYMGEEVELEEAAGTKRPPNFTMHPIDRQDYKILRPSKKTPPKDSKEWGRDGGEKKIKEEASKLQGTPVVSLSDFGSKDNTKNKYGQTVPKKLKPNDPRVKMYTEPKKEGVSEDLLAESKWEVDLKSPVARLTLNHKSGDVWHMHSGHDAKPAFDGYHLKKNGKSIGQKFMGRGAKGEINSFIKQHYKGVKEEFELDEAVSVEHDRYVRSHGKKASGSGNWMFTHKRAGDVDYKNNAEVHHARGSFADAAKSAKAWGKSHGHSTVYVMEEVESVKEGVAEGFADDFLKMAKEKNPNARIVTAVQKRKETEELMKKREESGVKPEHAPATGNPRPLGGYNPKSNRSYSEGVEIDEADELTLRFGGTRLMFNKTAAGRAREAKRKQEYLKGQMKFTKSQGGITGPKGKLPEEVELEEEQLDELSKKTLGSYVKKASWEAAINAAAGRSEPGKGHTKKSVKRLDGIEKAANKMTKEEFEIDEAVKKKLVIGSKVSHPQHGKGTVVQHSLGGGTMGTVVRFADGKKVRVDHKKLRMEEVEHIEEGVTVLSGRPTTHAEHHYSTSAGSHPASHVEKTLGLKSGSISKDKKTYIKHGDVHVRTTPAGKHVQVSLVKKIGKFGQDTSKHDQQREALRSKLLKKNEQYELDEKTLTPAELKKREEIAKAMERKNPHMDKSRKMAIATAVAKRVAEQYDDAE